MAQAEGEFKPSPLAKRRERPSLTGCGPTYDPVAEAGCGPTYDQVAEPVCGPTGPGCASMREQSFTQRSGQLTSAHNLFRSAPALLVHSAPPAEELSITMGNGDDNDLRPPGITLGLSVACISPGWHHGAGFPQTPASSTTRGFAA